MKPSTRQLIKSIKESNWFSNLGKATVVNATRIDTLNDAIAIWMDDDWESFTLEAANILGDRVRELSKTRYNQWNDNVEDIKKEILPLLEEKVTPFIQANSLDDIIYDIINWDVLHACLEQEYSDLIPIGFFNTLVECYNTGNIPCGWDGLSIENGSLKVY